MTQQICLSPITISDVEKNNMPETGIQNTVQRKFGIFLYPEYKSKQGKRSSDKAVRVSHPHVLEEAAAAAVLRALAALWGTGCCGPGVFAPTL